MCNLGREAVCVTGLAEKIRILPESRRGDSFANYTFRRCQHIKLIFSIIRFHDYHTLLKPA
jgi:hypothetical protein